MSKVQTLRGMAAVSFFAKKKSQEKVMTEIPKVKGPASYFPSIEKTYGKPIAHWMGILKQASEIKHMELVEPAQDET